MSTHSLSKANQTMILAEQPCERAVRASFSQLGTSAVNAHTSNLQPDTADLFCLFFLDLLLLVIPLLQPVPYQLAPFQHFPIQLVPMQ